MSDAAQSTARRPELISIEQILHARPQQPVASTRDRGWRGVTVDVHRPYFDCCERYAGLDHHLIGYCPTGTARLVQTRDGVVHDGVITAGTSYIMPSGCDSTWEGDSGHSVRIRVPPALTSAAAEQLSNRVGRVEIRNVFGVLDPVLERLAQSFLVEIDMRAHAAQTLIVDSLSTALVAHLIRSYNVFDAHDYPKDRSLGKVELTRLTQYIEANLDQPICLDDLATIVNVSRFHFSRLFKRTVGITALDFVERCRIRRAQMLIADTSLPLAQIALMTGFADQSHFTRRFHRHVGCTPAAYAREKGHRRASLRAVPGKCD